MEPELATLFEAAFASPAAGVKESFRVVLDLLRIQQNAIQDLSERIKVQKKECSWGLIVESVDRVAELEEQPCEINKVAWEDCGVTLHVLKFDNTLARTTAKEKLNGWLEDESTTTLLVRHVRERESLGDLLRIFEVEDLPSELNRFGMFTFRFASLLNAIGALSFLRDCELNGCALEASILHSSCLPRELQDLYDQLASEENAGATVMLTSVPSCVTSRHLEELFENQPFTCHLAPCRAAHGAFSIGSLIFENCEIANQAALDLSHGRKRVGTKCVGAVAVTEPETRVLNRRIGDLEKSLKDLELSHDRLEREATLAREERDEAREKDLDDLRQRLDALWKSQAKDSSETRRATADVESLCCSLQDSLEALRKDRRHESIADYVFSELEKLDILTSNERGDYVASDSLFSSNLCEDDLVKTVENRLRDVVLSNCVTTHQLNRACELAAAREDDDDDDLGISALTRTIRAEMLTEQVTTKTKLEELVDQLQNKIETDQNTLSKQLEIATSSIENVSDEQEKTLESILDTRKALDSRLAAVENGARARDVVLSVQVEESTFGLRNATENLSREKVDRAHFDSRLVELSERLESKMMLASSRDEEASVLESLRRKISSKLDKDEAIRLLSATRNEEPATTTSRDDALMIGALKYRCLGCNRLTSKMHDRHADKVVHAGLSPIPSTQTAAAAGLLRPLRLQTQPSRPRSSMKRNPRCEEP